MIQQTSKEAYQKIAPKLGQKQNSVFEVIRKLGECTDYEIAVFMNVPINTVTPRRGELEKMSLIYNMGRTSQNGRSAMTWHLK